jgi:hypothetical protein
LKFVGEVDTSEPLDDEYTIALEAISERSNQTQITQEYFEDTGYMKFKDLQEALFLDRLPAGRWNHYAIGDVTLLPVYPCGEKVPPLHLALYVLDEWKPRKVDEFSPIAYYNRRFFYDPALSNAERQENFKKGIERLSLEEKTRVIFCLPR